MSGHDLAATVIALPGDRWLSSSSMQKAIRRGHSETALRAAMNLWTVDKRSFWRRLHVLACEDGGIACVEAVVKILTAHEAPAWRRRVGDLRVGLFLVKLMSEAVKSRLADQLYTLCDRAPELHRLRQELAQADDDRLAGYVLDDCLSLQQRLLSLWLVAGTKRLPSDNLPQRQGSPAEAADVLRDLHTPADLTEACIGVMSRTQWPLALFVPLLWQEVQKQPSRLSNEVVPLRA